jgi:plasmid stabilization system protein ParE
MTFRVVVTPEAERDLDQVFRFVAREKPAAARKFVAGLRRRLKTLASMPRRCPRARRRMVSTASKSAISFTVNIESSSPSTAEPPSSCKFGTARAGPWAKTEKSPHGTRPIPALR